MQFYFCHSILNTSQNEVVGALHHQFTPISKERKNSAQKKKFAPQKKLRQLSQKLGFSVFFRKETLPVHIFVKIN